MRHYAVNDSAANATPPGTTVSTSAQTATAALGIITGTARCAQIYEVLVGLSGVAADASVLESIFFCSTLSAGTGITPVNISSLETASNTTASFAPTGAVRVGIAALRIPLNSRATVRWAAVDPDSRLFLPANGTTNNGAVQVENQQPGTVASLSLISSVYFTE